MPKITYEQGRPQKEPCPFNDSLEGKLLYRRGKEEDGTRVDERKCLLAERAKVECGGSGIFSSQSPDVVLERDGCPHPPTYSFLGGWRHHCKYDSGRWVEE